MKMIRFQKCHIATLVLSIISITFANPEKENIAVLDLDVKIKKINSQGLIDKLVTKLVFLGKSNNFSVFERSRIKEILDEQKFQKSHCSEDQCAIKIGKILNVDKVVLTSIQKIEDTEDTYSISFRMIDVGTSEIDQAVIRDYTVSDKKIVLNGIIEDAAYELAGVKKPDKGQQAEKEKIRKLRIISIGMFAASIGAGMGAIYFFADQKSIHNNYLDQTEKNSMDIYYNYERTAYTRAWVCSGFTMALMPVSVFLFIRQLKKGNTLTTNIELNIDVKEKAGAFQFTCNF